MHDPTGKSAEKSVGIPFQKGDDPRRGHGPAPGAPNAGRPPKALIEWAKEIVSDPAIQDVYSARAKAGDLKVFEFAADRAEGKAREHKEVSGKVEVVVKYDE